MHDVSGVYKPKPHSAIDRRRDVAVDQLQLLIIDLCLIRLDRAFRLPHSRLLGIELLFGDYAILKELLITPKIDLRVLL
jgi:hypothetical protein